MMYSYPFFSFPHFRRYPSYYPIPSYSAQYREKRDGSFKEKKQKEEASHSKAPSGFRFLDHLFRQEDRGEDEEYFDLFGIKLYHDDLLLLGLIFFLYKEDVKDQYLFFALILLLLS